MAANRGKDPVTATMDGWVGIMGKIVYIRKLRGKESS